MADGNYHPTLWRTCRVLANARRLACLKAVIVAPGSCVGDIAQIVRISETQASLTLRALQARGLISARRESRWVHYFPLTDPLVASAQPLLKALMRTFRRGGMSDAELMLSLTAFTHPRRLKMLRYLQKRAPVLAETLAARCGISQPAAYRHLRKLAARGLVAVINGRVTLTPRRDPLNRALLDLVALDV